MIRMEASLLVCSSSTTPHALSPVNKIFCVDISMSRVVGSFHESIFFLSFSFIQQDICIENKHVIESFYRRKALTGQDFANKKVKKLARLN